MPRFHFEVWGDERFPDPEGVALKSPQAARREARRLSAALQRDYPDVFVAGRRFEMRVLDSLGETLERFAITPGRPPSVGRQGRLADRRR